MILCLPLLAGWVTTALAQQEIWVFYLGRVLQGVGVMSSVTQVYLVEIADTERRGLFGASGALSVSVGITLVYCLGVSTKGRFPQKIKSLEFSSKHGWVGSKWGHFEVTIYLFIIIIIIPAI